MAIRATAMLERRAFLATIGAAAAGLYAAHRAEAQSYPSQPIRLINPYAPGGAVEAMSRIYAQKLAGNQSQMATRS
jgi:tripartite-type tricarboxylate transporter receptor subunit TctC